MKRLLFLIFLFPTVSQAQSQDFFYVLLNKCNYLETDFSKSPNHEIKEAPAMTIICYSNEMERMECKLIDNATKKEENKLEYENENTMNSLKIFKVKDPQVNQRLSVNSDKKAGVLTIFKALGLGKVQETFCSGKLYTAKDVNALKKEKEGPAKAPKNTLKVVPEIPSIPVIGD